MAGGGARWLLIGNSRWHWAEATSSGLRCWDEPPPPQPQPPLPPASGAVSPVEPQAWAAVGATAGLGLPEERRLRLEEVPLRQVPAWLGIDRALAGWGAWRRHRSPVLVADAGTALSLTLVDRDGRFVGGRLMAGVALQLRAMATGTQALPALRPQEVACQEPWPQPTDEAMLQGVRRGLAAAIAMAALERQSLDPDCRLVLTGGDAADLAPLVAAARAAWGPASGGDPRLEVCPDLCLEALASLRPPSPLRGHGLSSDQDR